MKIIDSNIKDYYREDKILVEKVFDDYSNYIYKIVKNANSIFKDEDIEEIINDVILALWRNQDRLDKNSKMSSYIAGITKNLIKKKYRGIVINENFDDYENSAININDIELDFLNKEQSKNIMNKLEKMKKEDRDIFLLYYYEELKIKDIAEKMIMSESKIKSKLFRMRNKLKKYLNEMERNDFYDK